MGNRLTIRKQKEFLSGREKDWHRRLRSLENGYDRDALHRLRVDLKKIRALVQLSEDCGTGRTGKEFQRMKRLFQQSGKVRDVDNGIQVLESYPSAPAAFKEQQYRQKHEAFKELTTCARKYRKKTRHAVLSHIHSISDTCIRDWYAVQIVNIGLLLTNSGDDWHKARKLIKRLVYLLNVLPSALAGELRLDKDYLDQLQDAIGVWHDASMTVTAWAGKDLADSQQMIKDCQEKENKVRELAQEFYLRAHA